MNELLHYALLVKLNVLNDFLLLLVCSLELAHLTPEFVTFFCYLNVLRVVLSAQLLILILEFLELLLKELAIEAFFRLALLLLVLQLQFELLCFASELYDLRASLRVLVLFLLNKLYVRIYLLLGCSFDILVLFLLHLDFLPQLLNQNLIIHAWRTNLR